jgi:hypothetical protein
MCRNIRPLFNFDPPATDAEIESAALQFVRKVSGYTRPAAVNEAAFTRAVAEIASVTAQLLSELEITAAPRDREVEAAKARARSSRRFG